ncbi:MAG TPA: class D sortase [Thermoanaerobaculia bacterium]|jgi:sortase A
MTLFWRRASGALIFSGLLVLAIPASHRAAGVIAQSRALSVAPSHSLSAPRGLLAGEPVGRIRIARLAIDYAVFEGTTDAVLRKGPGHLLGTAWPGLTAAPGNCVIAGHRDSFFRSLARARVGDVVTLTGPEGRRDYRLTGSRIVTPDDLDAARPLEHERLTLVSCYPFRWAGPAPYRIVWTGVPIGTALRKTLTAS